MTLRKISAPGPGVNAPADWSQWRGPLRDGHCVGFKAPTVWPKTLTKKWTVNVGESHSSPIVAGGKGDAESKIEAMKKAGIIVADSPATLGEAVLKAIG